MPSIHRVLDPHPTDALTDYVAAGGGAGLDAARRLEGVGIAEEIKASGLRGRGGAGFSTGVKWENVASAATTGPPPIVVVNGAEGEPGSFKDRTLLRQNPYKVLEGALIAASAVHARHVVVALKQTFQVERRRIAYAIAELSDAGWLSDVDLRVAIGPSEYLFGEETALLEVIEGRQPFPRIAPPYRQGLTTDGDAKASTDQAGNQSPGVGLVLANNVETLANVPGIVVNGADWFRSVGTSDSPGTVVCTVSGDTRRAGVAEFPMGTTIAEIVDEIGGGALDERRIIAAISGVANAILPVELFDTPACYEAMKSIGSGLGAAGFIVFDDATDLISVAEGVSRFLAVESCGQCEPCKRDGMAVAAALDELRRSESDGDVVGRLRDWLGTITDGARCYLATQHQVVATSILDLYPGSLDGHVDRSLSPAEPVLIAPIVDLEDGQVVLDTSQVSKQPDWSYDEIDSGRWPAAYLGDTPVAVTTRRRRLASGDGATALGGVASGGESSGDDGDLVDGANRPILVDVGDQLDLAHHELVAALLATAMHGGDSTSREAAVEEFAGRLERHVEVTTRVLLPWVRRVGGDEGERVAERAEAIQSAAAGLVEVLRGISSGEASDRPLHTLADELHRLILDEERSVLPLLERHLGDSELDDIGRAMHEV